jgi:hypothetical protein
MTNNPDLSEVIYVKGKIEKSYITFNIDNNLIKELRIRKEIKRKYS